MCRYVNCRFVIPPLPSKERLLQTVFRRCYVLRNAFLQSSADPNKCLGARVGGLGNMPGWWFTIESTTSRHFIQQLKTAIEDAIRAKPTVRAIMRARAVKQRFPVSQWVEDLEKLQSTAIETSHKQAAKEKRPTLGSPSTPAILETPNLLSVLQSRFARPSMRPRAVTTQAPGQARGLDSIAEGGLLAEPTPGLGSKLGPSSRRKRPPPPLLRSTTGAVPRSSLAVSKQQINRPPADGVRRPSMTRAPSTPNLRSRDDKTQQGATQALRKSDRPSMKRSPSMPQLQRNDKKAVKLLGVQLPASERSSLKAPKQPPSSSDDTSTSPSTGLSSPFTPMSAVTIYETPASTPTSSSKPENSTQASPTKAAPTKTAPAITGPTIADDTETAHTIIESIVPEPSIADPTKTATIITEPSKIDPTESVPTVIEPTITEPIRTGPAESTPIIIEPTVTGPTKTAPVITGPIKTDHTEDNPIITGPTIPRPTKTAPTLSGPKNSAPTKNAPKKKVAIKKAPTIAATIGNAESKTIHTPNAVDKFPSWGQHYFPYGSVAVLSASEIKEEKPDNVLQNVTPFFSDPQKEYESTFKQKLQNLDGKNSENELCIEEYLLKSEKSWFGKRRAAELSRGPEGPPQKQAPTTAMVQEARKKAGDEEGFGLGADYKPPSGLKRIVRIKFGDWPIYSLLLAFVSNSHVENNE